MITTKKWTQKRLRFAVETKVRVSGSVKVYQRINVSIVHRPWATISGAIPNLFVQPNVFLRCENRAERNRDLVAEWVLGCGRRAVVNAEAEDCLSA